MERIIHTDLNKVRQMKDINNMTTEELKNELIKERMKSERYRQRIIELSKNIRDGE